MCSITVAQLRQNPTAALNAAADGIPSEVTKHGRVVARLVPPEGDEWVPAEQVRDLFARPVTEADRAWAAEVEAERDRDRIDPV